MNYKSTTTKSNLKSRPHNGRPSLPEKERQSIIRHTRYNAAEDRVLLAHVSKAGVKTVYAALLLYYVLTDSKMPIKDRAVILGALGYFICPVDAIPDLLGPLGYTDDLAALGYALKSVWDNITPETHRSARRRLHEWFGEVPDSELELF